jgi:FixJ family two-component response regulator
MEATPSTPVGKPKHNGGLEAAARYFLQVVPQESRFVAIVDDDELMRGALQGLLRKEGLPARAFASGEEFLSSGAQHLSSCLLADIQMPGMSGLELQARLNAEQIRVPVIFITAHDHERIRMQALKSGAVDVLAKPFDDAVLLRRVRAALEP